MDSTPASLLQRLRRPDEAVAWDDFVELYTPVLFRWAECLGLQNADAADLVQDVFMILVRKLPDFDYNEQKSFRAWLKTVVLNRWRDRRRARIPATTGQPWEDLPDHRQNEMLPDDEYLRILIQGALGRIESEFAPTLWQAFRRYFFAGQSPVEIARDLHLSPGTVYAVKSKVLLRLRQDLRELLD